ncbi:MAG: toxin-antitoxin system HicB family antitoxin, partial [Candidatus Nitrosocosmicus sp.]
MSKEYDIEKDDNKTDPMTFRIEKDIIEKLRQGAKSKGITLNTFINQIIRNFLDWHIFEPK